MIRNPELDKLERDLAPHMPSAAAFYPDIIVDKDGSATIVLKRHMVETLPDDINNAFRRNLREMGVEARPFGTRSYYTPFGGGKKRYTAEVRLDAANFRKLKEVFAPKAEDNRYSDAEAAAQKNAAARRDAEARRDAYDAKYHPECYARRRRRSGYNKY